MSLVKPVANDLLQIRSICYTPQQISENVMHWRVRDPVITGGATLQEIATALSTTWNGAYINYMPTDARFRGVGAKCLTPPVSLEYHEVGDDGAGNGSADLTPTQTAAIIKKITLNGGRKNRGRIYVGFVDAANVSATGGMNAAGQTKLLAIATAIGITQTIVGAGGTTTIDLVVWHPPVPGDFTLVDRLEETLIYATQRRRGQYGRRNFTPW